MPMTDETFQAAFTAVQSRFGATLSESAGQFLGRVYARGLQPYRDRLDALGFSGKEKILDAGCGFGQWTFALAERNGRVDAVDSKADRIGFLQAMQAEADFSNVASAVGDLLHLRADDDEYDAIFCYSVIPNLRWKEALQELLRVLKPGGVLYFNANDIGWYRRLWDLSPHEAPGYSPREVAFRALENAVRYERGLPLLPGHGTLIGRDEVVAFLTGQGHACRVAGEGGLVAEGYSGAAPAAFLPSEYDGDVAVYEALAVKAADGAAR